MTDYTDIKLVKLLDDDDVETGIFDIEIGDDGDFEKVEGFETAIQMSFFGEVRANESEVPRPEMRRGWIGNELNNDPDYEIGSKIWLLFQARATLDTRNRAVDYAREGFSWMLTDNLLKEVRVDGLLLNSNILLDISLVRLDSVIENIQYLLWENTDLEDMNL